MPKMKAHATFDLYLADQPAKNRALIRTLRAFVKKSAPELEESVKWGNGCWLADGAPIAYVYSDTDHVQFGFIRGSELADPKRLLQGNGAYVRHVKVRKRSDIDTRTFGALLRQAVRAGPVTRAPKESATARKARKRPSPEARPRLGRSADGPPQRRRDRER